MQSKDGIVGATADTTVAVLGPHTPHNTSPTQASPSKHQFNKTDLESYRDYCATIKNLEEENLEAKAESQPLLIEAAAMQRDAACEKWRNAKAAEAEAKKLLDNREKWNLGKLFFPKSKRGAARQEAQRIEREQQLDYSVAAVNRAFMELETAKTRLHDAESERDSLRSRLSDLYLTRCNQNALIERMFAHPNWSSDPILAPLRLEIQELEQQVSDACTDEGTYYKTYKILTLSKDKIHHLMEDFRSNSTMDLFQFSSGPNSRNILVKRGTVVLEPQHRRSIQAANELLQLVAEEVDAAKNLLPVLPFHDESLIESARTGIFEPILRPDFVGNTEGQIRLKMCMDTLVQLKKEVLNCLQYAQRNVTRDGREAPVLKQLRVEIAAKKEEMAEYQHSLLEAALKIL